MKDKFQVAYDLLNRIKDCMGDSADLEADPTGMHYWDLPWSLQEEIDLFLKEHGVENGRGTDRVSS